MNSTELARLMGIMVALVVMSMAWMARAASQTGPPHQVDGATAIADYYVINPYSNGTRMSAGNETLINVQSIAYPGGNHTIYMASLLNSSGWLDGYAVYIPPNLRGAVLMVKAPSIEPGLPYLLVVYEANSTSTYLGYAWLPGGEALSLINDGSAWTRAVTMLPPLSDYARGNVKVRVMLPSGPPAGNGTVCAIPPPWSSSQCRPLRA